MMEEKDDIVYKFLCMVCLCAGRSLHKVTDSKIKQFYIDALNEIPMCRVPETFPMVCWECKAMLKKLVSFREQVKDSYRILQTYTHENLHDCLATDVIRPPRLKVQVNTPISIVPSKECSDTDTRQETIYVKNELKVEWENGKDRNIIFEGDDHVSDHSVETGSMEMVAEIETFINKIKKGKKRKKYCNVKVHRAKKKVINTTNEKESYHDTLLTNEVSLPRQKGQVNTPIDDAPTEESSDTEIEADTAVVKNELPIEWQNGKEEINVTSKLDNAVRNISVETDEKKLDKEIETFINKIKKGKKRRGNVDVKVNRAKRKINSLKIEKKQRPKYSKYQNKKILTIELSYEEVLKEREKELVKKRYVKAAYKCETCLVGFNYSKSYQSHMQTKHSPELGNYSCPICKTIISSVESFTAHYKRHMRRYECSICHKRTMDVKVMYQHYYLTHEISLKEYKCNLCGKISNSIDTHRYHRDSHKARVACPECDKTFSHRAGLMNHRLAVHELQNAFPCEVCGKVFRWKTSLKRHLEKHDAKSKSMESASAPYCSPCGVTFASLCSYQRHMKNSLKHVTQEQLRFICDDCNRRFADKTKLRDHIEEKHLHRTFHCHICQKPSKNRVSLDQHIRNVHKGRPNTKMCHHCGKGFPTKVQLESHIRTHTGERPFICEYCPTTFSQQSNLYKHNRQVHLNMKSKRYSGCKKKDKTEPSADVTAANDTQFNRAFTITLFRDGFCETLPDPRVASVL